MPRHSSGMWFEWKVEHGRRFRDWSRDEFGRPQQAQLPEGGLEPGDVEIIGELPPETVQ